MPRISELRPREVWGFFGELLSLPRPSGSEDRVAGYLTGFAGRHAFPCRRDPCGNVIFSVPPSAGYERAPRVILQAHMDMVPVSDPGVSHDFKRDPIAAYVDGPFVKARGTTLGADDGIGIATILALADRRDLKHGPLTCVFTVEEETTMRGAQGLEARDLAGDYLINLDSEENGRLYIGCAGSCDVGLLLKAERIAPDGCRSLRLKLSGLTGGHSGADIHLGRGNAIRLLAALLDRLAETRAFFIQDISGGSVRNALPAGCEATLSVPAGELAAFREEARSVCAGLLSVYRQSDPRARLDFEEPTGAGEPPPALTRARGLQLIRLLRGLPDGVSRMSDIDPAIVETSANVGVVRTTADGIAVCVMPRSLKEEALDEIIGRVTAVAALADGVELTAANRYPCWLSNSESPLIDCLNRASAAVCGQPFHITLMHAGLETGIFAKTAPHLQLVSLGATVLSPHSTLERVDIKGVAMVYDIMCRALAALN